jgi:hypothetical protein
MSVRLVQLFDQADLKDLAAAEGVSAGICGYVSALLCAHLAAKPSPTNHESLDSLIEELQGSAQGIVEQGLHAAIAAVRGRRERYADAHLAEFAPEGSSYEESVDEEGRQRTSRAVYMQMMLSIADMRWLLEKEVTDGGESVTPEWYLLRNVQTLYLRKTPDGACRETHSDIMATLSSEEDRACIRDEVPFSAGGGGAALVGRVMAVWGSITDAPEEALPEELVAAPVLVMEHSVIHGGSAVFMVRPAEAAEATGGEETVEGGMLGTAAAVHQLLPMFLDTRHGASTLESYFERSASIAPTLGATCSAPIVVETRGHFNVALPLELLVDGTTESVVLVLESMANPVAIQHRVLAAAQQKIVHTQKK